MSPNLVVVLLIRIEQITKMPFAEDNDVVKTVMDSVKALPMLASSRAGTLRSNTAGRTASTIASRTWRPNSLPAESRL